MPSAAGGEKPEKKKIVFYSFQAARVISNLLFYVLLIVLLVLIFFMVQSRLQGSVPSAFGYQFFSVISGSMRPTIDVGSVVAVKPVEPENLEEGDIITFTGMGQGLTTHRVVEIKEKEEELNFITKGDANETRDADPVLPENVVGRVSTSIPHAGYAADFVQSREGLLLLVILPGMVIIGTEVKKLYKYISEARSNKNSSEH